MLSPSSQDEAREEVWERGSGGGKTDLWFFWGCCDAQILLQTLPSIFSGMETREAR